MRSPARLSFLASLAVLSLGACTQMPAGSSSGTASSGGTTTAGASTAATATSSTSSAAAMSFFVASTGNGRGANFGGLTGADAHCQTLATAAGAGGKTWRAYLSTNAAGGTSAVNARERIGSGPWHNAKGVLIASTVEDLHAANNINKQTALTEKGDVVSGRGDSPNMHDILTGSTPDGRASDATCANWTAAGEGSAIVGHHDRMGLDEQPPAKSWNSSHPSRGCSLDALKATGGAGLLYCFATR